MFIHREEETGRLKASYGALYDTDYLYCATYNWRLLYLVAGFEHVASTAGNRSVEHVWRELMDDNELGCGLEAEEVGWLAPGTTVESVRCFLCARNLIEFDLARPKPLDAPRQDATMSGKGTPFSAIPKQEWVKRRT